MVENVPGLLTSHSPDEEKGAFFERIVTDLAQVGYRCGWCVYGACEVGAPHRRERVFIIGYLPTAAAAAELAHHDRDGRGNGAHQYLNECGSHAQAHTRPQGQGPNAGTQVGYEQRAELAHADSIGHQKRDGRSNQDRPCTIAQCARTGPPQSDMGRDHAGIPAGLDRARLTEGWPGWPARPCELPHDYEPERTITHDLKRRRSRLKALGNAIAPQQI